MSNNNNPSNEEEKGDPLVDEEMHHSSSNSDSDELANEISEYEMDIDNEEEVLISFSFFENKCAENEMNNANKNDMDNSNDIIPNNNSNNEKDMDTYDPISISPWDENSVTKLDFFEDVIDDMASGNGIIDDKYNDLIDLKINGIDLTDQNNKPFILYIINSFETQPSLWNFNDSSYQQSDAEKIELVKEIANNLQTKYQKVMSVEEIRKFFKKLYELYVNEKLLHAIWNDEVPLDPNQSWLVVELSFLNKFRKPIAFTNRHDENLYISDIYKKYRPLWDKDVSDRQLKRKAFAKMLKEVNIFLPTNMSSDRLMKNVRILRRCVIANHREKIISDLKGKNYVPPHPIYAYHLQFLEGHLGPFLCSFCNIIETGYQLYKSHLTTHTGESCFKCDVCDKTFTSFSNMKVHKRSHTGEKPYTCDVCGARFKMISLFKIHERMHTGERPYVCDVCGTTFNRIYSFLRHKQIHVRNSQPVILHQCDKCQRNFKSQKSLDIHNKMHDQILDYMCAICGDRFHSSRILAQHSRIHDKERKYQCPICKKKFAQSSGLYSHKKYRHSANVATRKNSESNNLRF